jgi:hypothetical protein
MARRLTQWLLPAALLAALASVHAKQVFSSTQSLAFGRFVAGTGGTITVAPNGARSQTGGVTLLTSTVTAASFTNSDNSRKAVLITLPADGSVVLSSGANQMTLKSFTSSPSGTGLMVNDSLTILVGATLTVAPNQPKGNYSGSIPVTIQYQ